VQNRIGKTANNIIFYGAQNASRLPEYATGEEKTK
jgi:hypothetical protein